MVDLARHVAVFNGLRERIATAYDLDREDEAVVTTAAGECNVEAAIVSALRDAREAGAHADGVGGIIDALRARQARLKQKADTLRKAAAWAMDEIGQPKIVAPDMTVSLGKSRAELILSDGMTMPERFLKEAKRVPDLVALRAALDAGEEVEGARLGNSAPTLTVRTR